LVFTRYAREPFNFLYNEGSTKFENKFVDKFRFGIIGVAGVCDPSFEISLESPSCTSLFQGRPHLYLMKPLEPESNV
jgi:hypothetical protein